MKRKKPKPVPPGQYTGVMENVKVKNGRVHATIRITEGEHKGRKIK